MEPCTRTETRRKYTLLPSPPSSPCSEARETDDTISSLSSPSSSCAALWRGWSISSCSERAAEEWGRGGEREGLRSVSAAPCLNASAACLCSSRKMAAVACPASNTTSPCVCALTANGEGEEGEEASAAHMITSRCAGGGSASSTTVARVQAEEAVKKGRENRTTTCVRVSLSASSERAKPSTSAWSSERTLFISMELLREEGAECTAPLTGSCTISRRCPVKPRMKPVWYCGVESSPSKLGSNSDAPIVWRVLEARAVANSLSRSEVEGE
mmetsp:Transcript_18943/g.48274  ORF Transcript_18943/g.48274 Transcript_18943/m.48274 type:complete len:271 (+) Transcript_18943:1167-1979(+)